MLLAYFQEPRRPVREKYMAVNTATDALVQSALWNQLAILRICKMIQFRNCRYNFVVLLETIGSFNRRETRQPVSSRFARHTPMTSTLQRATTSQQTDSTRSCGITRFLRLKLIRSCRRTVRGRHEFTVREHGCPTHRHFAHPCSRAVLVKKAKFYYAVQLASRSQTRLRTSSRAGSLTGCT